MSTTDEPARFEDVEWDDIERSRRYLTAERVSLLLGTLLIAALYLYNEHVVYLYVLFDWRLTAVDIVFLFSLVALIAYGFIPAIRYRTKLRSILSGLRSRTLMWVASAYLLVVGFAGLIGPALAPDPEAQAATFNPPVGFTSTVHGECAGEETGDLFNLVCHGSWQYPLGTGRLGERFDLLLLAGARPTLYVIVIGAVIVVPIATAVGVIAGLYGGWADRLLMSYVDLQLSIPAILIYFIAYMTWRPSLLLFLLAFALLSWGDIARLVRSETIQRRSYGHVRVAASLGASRRYLAKRHILPNITNTLIPAVCHVLALLVLYEAGLAFLGYHEAAVTSWGSLISEHINAEVAGQHQTRTDLPAHEIWWMSTLPAIALTLTMLSFKLLGDGFRDALDPRGGNQ